MTCRVATQYSVRTVRTSHTVAEKVQEFLYFLPLPCSLSSTVQVISLCPPDLQIVQDFLYYWLCTSTRTPY